MITLEIVDMLILDFIMIMDNPNYSVKEKSFVQNYQFESRFGFDFNNQDAIMTQKQLLI